MRAILGLLVVLQALTTHVLTAQTLSARWSEELREIDGLLAEEKWSKADRLAKRLRNEMYESLVGKGQRHLGMLSALRAVAVYGNGDEHAGEWMWRAAMQFFPEVANLDLARYGQVGERLANLEESPANDESDATDSVDEGLKPPRKLKEIMPEFPIARRLRDQTVSLVVECIIDVDGRPYHPRVLQASEEYVLVFAALEALGRWRFEPATRDGEPIAVWYRLAVNFVVR